MQDLQLKKRHLSIFICEEALQELSTDISTHTPLLTCAFCCRGWGEISSSRDTSPSPSLSFVPCAPVSLLSPPSSPVHTRVPKQLTLSLHFVIIGATLLLWFLLLLAGILVAWPSELKGKQD